MSLPNIQNEINAGIVSDYYAELFRTLTFIKDTPTHYFYNKLSEETGEVAEVAAAFMGSETKIDKLLKKHITITDAMLEELSDTYNVVMILAARHGLSITDIIEEGTRKLKSKNDNREV